MPPPGPRRRPGATVPLPRRTASPTGETGRGLLLVDALTARWGTEPWPPSGKVVWAEIGLPHPVPTASASGAQPTRAHVHGTPGGSQAEAATAHARDKAPSRP
jgi:hypothetical protein